MSGGTDETLIGMTGKLKFGKFYELIIGFYHWLRRCIEGYMERNRVSWYCETRVSVNRSEPSCCTEI